MRLFDGNTTCFIEYLSIYFHFLTIEIEKNPKTFIFPRIFSHTVNYLALLESCPSDAAKGTSIEGQRLFIFDLQSLQNT